MINESIPRGKNAPRPGPEYCHEFDIEETELNKVKWLK